MSSVVNLVYQQATDFLYSMYGSRPHGDKLCWCRVVLIKKRAGDATCCFAVHRQESGASLAIHSFYPGEPLRIGKLRLFSVSRTKRVRGIQQRAEAYSFKDKSVQRRDLPDCDQRVMPSSQKCRHVSLQQTLRYGSSHLLHVLL